MNSKSTPEIIRTAVQDLERGAHVIYDASPFDDTDVYEVGQVVQYADHDDVQMVAALLTPVVGGEPAMLRRPVGDLIAMASEEQVAAAVAERTREQVIRDLNRLIGLIREQRLTIRPYGGPHISIDLADGEVSRLAERLGVETTKYGTQRQVSWPVRDSCGQLSVSFHGVPADEPAYRVEITDGTAYVNPIDLTAGTVTVTEEFSGDVIARGTVTGPGVTAQAGE